MQIKDWIKAEAMRLGFSLAGITSLAPPPHLPVFRNWISSGRQAGMAYLSAETSLAKRADPRLILPAAKSLICVAIPYAASSQWIESKPGQPTGRVASYAWGIDYHEVIPSRLAELAGRLSAHLERPVAFRAYTDTGPILERDLAQRAGLGWAGKNTCLIHPQRGSFFFLGELLVDVELEPDEPYAADRCGACRRCITACPMGCIREDRSIDAGRCISYLTIENKGPIPRELRPQLGNWIFGCDLCQQVCPWNRFAANNDIDPAFQARPGIPAPELLAEIQLDVHAFNQKFQQSPIQRARRRGYLRNVCVALGNSHCDAALPILKKIIQAEPEALIRGAAVWAFNQIDPPAARQLFGQILAAEEDPLVRQEIRAALGEE